MFREDLQLPEPAKCLGDAGFAVLGRGFRVSFSDLISNTEYRQKDTLIIKGLLENVGLPYRLHCSFPVGDTPQDPKYAVG